MTALLPATIDMGRPKTTYPDLPPRMTARALKSGKVLFYYTGNGKKEPLGPNYGSAVKLWAEKESQLGGGPVTKTFSALADEWERNGLDIGRRGKPRASRTQDEYMHCLPELHRAFGKARFEEIRPIHIRQYLDRRSKKAMANREITVLAIIWNWARSKGYTDSANPCIGIERNYEAPRDRYVTDAEFTEIWGKAPVWMQDLMDLLRLTYQRPSDVLSRRRTDISEGRLWFAQSKTGKKLGFLIEGEFAEVLDRILNRQRPVSTIYLIADKHGQPFGQVSVSQAFRRVAGACGWQLRDLRAKAVTDTEDIRVASERAGHSDERITRRVYDRRKGVKVRPLR